MVTETEGKIKVSVLTPHPKNTYYFDDMDGDAWDALIQSISTSGVTNAVTITDKKVIISGHQRVRACKVLGIDEVSYKMIHYDSENDEIKDLIESNLRQRVLGNPNPVKMGRCFEFLQEYYGIEHGGDRGNQFKEAKPKLSALPNQHDLAEQYGISADTIQNYVKLAKSNPALADFVENGVISKSAALNMIKYLSDDEQEQLVSQLDAAKKYTQKQVQQYIDKIRNGDSKISSLETELRNVQNNCNTLRAQLAERPEKEVEVIPKDYETIKQRVEDYKSDYKQLSANFDKAMQENSEHIREIQDLKRRIAQSEEPQEQFKQKIKDETIFFCAKVATFIKEVGGYVWLADYINEMPDYEKKSYLSAVNNVGAWVENIRENINR